MGCRSETQEWSAWTNDDGGINKENAWLERLPHKSYKCGSSKEAKRRDGTYAERLGAWVLAEQLTGQKSARSKSLWNDAIAKGLVSWWVEPAEIDEEQSTAALEIARSTDRTTNSGARSGSRAGLPPTKGTNETSNKRNSSKGKWVASSTKVGSSIAWERT